MLQNHYAEVQITLRSRMTNGRQVLLVVKPGVSRPPEITWLLPTQHTTHGLKPPNCSHVQCTVVLQGPKTVVGAPGGQLHEGNMPALQLGVSLSLCYVFSARCDLLQGCPQQCTLSVTKVIVRNCHLPTHHSWGTLTNCHRPTSMPTPRGTVQHPGLQAPLL